MDACYDIPCMVDGAHHFMLAKAEKDLLKKMLVKFWMQVFAKDIAQKPQRKSQTFCWKIVQTEITESEPGLLMRILPTILIFQRVNFLLGRLLMGTRKSPLVF